MPKVDEHRTEAQVKLLVPAEKIGGLIGKGGNLSLRSTLLWSMPGIE